MTRVFLAMLLVLAAPPINAQNAASLSLEPCRIDGGSALGTAKANCGTLTVAENPSEPDGNQIDLYVALVPALSVNPEPDPLVIFAGGPGQSAVDSYLMIRSAFEPIRQKRPILLVDQRGTGRSNLMSCPPPPDEAMDDFSEQMIRQLTEECLAQLPGNPALYTTSLAVQDLDAVRQALGFEQLNLWGGSYGTRVALHYLRRFPEATRTVIVDGVAPPEEVLGPMMANDAQASLDQLTERCLETPECTEQFGNVSDNARALLAQLTEQSIEIEVAHPRTGELTPLTVSPDVMAGVVRLSVYSPATRALLPLMITEALDGDFRLMGTQALMIAQQMDGMMAGGMHNSVVCAEDAPFYNDDELPSDIGETFMRETQYELLRVICESWPVGPIDDDFHEPVVSDKPVLILSGEYDPVTPASNGEKILASLSNATHLVGPKQGHIISGTGCVPGLVAKFVATADIAAVDGSCVERLGGMPFFVSPLGPKP